MIIINNFNKFLTNKNKIKDNMKFKINSRILIKMKIIKIY